MHVHIHTSETESMFCISFIAGLLNMSFNLPFLQVYVSNSAKYNELGHPFGYLKASTALTCVNLFVMPYNYPVLLPLLGKSFLHVLLWKAKK